MTRRWVNSGRLLALCFLCALVTACGGGQHTTTPTAPPSLPLPSVHRPNIVFVLTDDLSVNLLRFMPHVRAMERDGLRFKNYFVSDSLCCPSRSSIFTGNLPHDTQVFSNFGSDGGFNRFHRRGEESHTFAVALQREGYRTALMGKYLNGYMATAHAADGAATDVTRRYIPPGWNEWDVSGWGYPEFNYAMNQNGTIHRYGHRPRAYMTDVLSRLGTAFIARSAATHRPFFLELATFAPHGPYTPAPRDAHRFPGLKAPRPPSFNRLPTRAPDWLVAREKLNRQQIRRINRVFQLRARSVVAVDRLIGAVEAALQRARVESDTYLVFSSDNGFHTGEYRLLPGKLTAFDTDIHVPLVVTGPHVPRGQTTAAMAENIDLAKTFTAMGGTTLSGDGRSLFSLIKGARPRDWRDAVIVEHHGPDMSGGDPDFQRSGAGNPRSYEAMRTARFLYVEYDDGERELYDLRTDPFELDNLAGELPENELARLHQQLLWIETCHNGRQCWAAMHVRQP